MGKLVAVTRRKISKSFGMIAIKDYGLTPSHIERSLNIQAREFSNTSTCRLLGDILVTEKLLTEDQKDSIIIDMTYSEKEDLSTDGGDKASLQNGLTKEANNKIILNRRKKKFFRQRALDKIFCKSAINRNFATETEVLRALEEQLLHFSKKLEIKKVREILTDKSIMSQSQAELIDISIKAVHISLPQDQEDTDNSPEKSDPSAEKKEKPSSPRAKSAVKAEVTSIAKTEVTADKKIKTEGEQDKKSDEQNKQLGTEQNLTTQKKTLLIGQNNAFELTLSEGDMEARIKLVGNMPEGMTTANLKELLAKHNITYGVVDDVALEMFILREGQKKDKNSAENEDHLSITKEDNITDAKSDLFTVAKGIPVKPGRNAMIKIFFEDENSRFGKELDSGNFDYRERGEIFAVAEGTILAEKIPLIPAVNGMTVSGKEITAPAPVDLNLNFDKGVALSKDGLKLIATANGRPDITMGGRISVVPEKIIKGNVDFKVGNVKFNGDVIVQGTILAGFSVTAKNLTANDIEEAEVNVANTLFVKNSIINSNITTEGTVAAQIIKKSTIFARGDVVVQKELIDCTVITSGRVIVPRGRIVASNIHAAKGVEAKNIGSETASPCHIFSGADDHAIKILKTFLDRINSRKEYLIQLQDLEIQYGQHMIQQLNNLTEISKMQEQLVKDKNNLLNDMKRVTNEIVKKQMEQSLVQLDKNLLKIDETINKLFDKHDATQNKDKELKIKIEDAKNQIEILLKEKQGFESWYEAQKEERLKKGADVLVQGTLFAGTRIDGTHASITIKSTIKNSRIHQAVNNDDPVNPFHEMRIDPIGSTAKMHA
ncbi:MAG: DUF342 domain-containing protein [Desulfamplus sp.]|nr:DUF342 domain-containing protein [Desulfamplus sp.]